MNDPEPPAPIRACFERLRAGDPGARAELLRLTHDRVLAMTRKMLARYPAVRRWEGSDDVLQAALIRLERCFAEGLIRSPDDFFRLAATQIRREVIDLFRRYYGPRGIGANHATPNEPAPHEHPGGADRHDSAGAAQAIELHELVDALPVEVRDAVLLRWYLEMTLPEVAAALGVSLAKVKRLMIRARVLLGEHLGLDSSADAFS